MKERCILDSMVMFAIVFGFYLERKRLALNLDTGKWQFAQIDTCR